jgi:hypothetical protein
VDPGRRGILANSATGLTIKSRSPGVCFEEFQAPQPVLSVRPLNVRQRLLALPLHGGPGERGDRGPAFPAEF